MRNGICNANGHLIDVITLLTAHWEAGERACKRDKIKRDSSCSNLSHNSGIKLQHSNCSDSHHSHCWHLLLRGFGGCSWDDAGCWAVKGRSRWGRSRKSQTGEWIRDVLSLGVVWCNVSGCCSEESWQNGRRWRGTQWQCVPAAVRQGDAQERKGRDSSWHGLWPLQGSQVFVGCFWVTFHIWFPRPCLGKVNLL